MTRYARETKDAGQPLPRRSNAAAAAQFADNRPEAVLQRRLAEMADNSPRLVQLSALAGHQATHVVQLGGASSKPSSEAPAANTLESLSQGIAPNLEWFDPGNTRYIGGDFTEAEITALKRLHDQMSSYIGLLGKSLKTYAVSDHDLPLVNKALGIMTRSIQGSRDAMAPRSDNVERQIQQRKNIQELHEKCSKLNVRNLPTLRELFDLPADKGERDRNMRIIAALSALGKDSEWKWPP